MPGFPFRLRPLLSAVVLLVAASTAISQPVQLPGVSGGHINTITVIGSDLYAACGVDVYRSTDTGQTWSSVAANLPLATSSHCVARFGTTLLAGTHAGLYRTADEGAHWIKADPTLTFGSCYAISNDDSVILVDDWPYGIFRATSAEGPWTNVLPMTRQVQGMLRSNGSVYVATQGDGVYETDDDGTTWKHLAAGFTGNGSYVMSIAEYQGSIILGTIEGMYQWDAAASTWQKFTGPATQSVMGLGVIGADLYANDGVSHVYRFHGGSWSDVSTGLPQFEQTRAMAVLGSKVFIAVSEVGVFGADASNTQWSSQSAGIGSLTIFRVLNFPLGDGTTGLIAGGDDADFGRAWLSTDHGDTWRSADNLTNRGFHDFSWRAGTLFAASDGDGIFASQDDGKTWFNATTETTYPGALCSTPNVILTGTTGFTQGVLRSTDNGSSWHSATTNIPGANVDHVYYDSLSARAFAGTGGIAFYASSDDGDNWQQVTPGPTALTGLARLGSLLVAGDRTGIFLSNDNGVTWRSTAPFTNVGAVETIGTAVLAGAGNKLWIARDGSASGLDWTLYDSLPSAIAIASIAHDDKYVYLGTHNYGLWRTALPSATASVAESPNGQADLVTLARSGDRLTLSTSIADGLTIQIVDLVGRTLFRGDIADANEALQELHERPLLVRALAPESSRSQVLKALF